MRIVSWNVNGLRSILRKGFAESLHLLSPDILCLQETRCGPDDVETLWLAGYHTHWNSAERKGYSGTAILTRTPPLQVTRGMGVPSHDREGRLLTAEFDGFFLVNVYVPNSQRELTRLPYRQEWDADFLRFLKKLQRRKPVVFCGDFNVAHNEIDLARPKDNVRNHGFTIEERRGFDAFLRAGFVDAFRHLTPGGGHYTWWSPMHGARARNIGWRIDYLMISKSLVPQLKSAFIRPEIAGSDHCPVGIDLE